jgi:predicted ribosomally synthesized peptide with SipW-like signal peptide
MKRILASSALILSAAGIFATGSTGAFFSDTETSNGNMFTAGAIDLKIDNTSYYNGVLNQATTWIDAVDLVAHKFFDFGDIKPGDIGEDTISLHVNTNSAYLCANVTLTSNDDNGVNEPEAGDGDTTDGAGQGELAAAVNFLWWADDGDNVLETDENVISQGPIGALPLNQPFPVTLADASKNIWNALQAPGPVDGNTTKYIGKGWCFGAITTSPAAQDGAVVDVSPQDGIPDNGPASSRGGGFTCSGAALNNITQTDSLTADVSFQAVQSRNNPGFLCPTGHCPIGSANQLLVAGAGFENPEVTNGAQWDIFPSVTGGWTVEWRSDVPATFNGDNRPAVANLEYHEGVLGLASEGDQYIELDSDWGGPSSGTTGEPASVNIYQDIATVPGKNYQIRYMFAARPDTPAADNNVEVRWGGAVVDTTGPTVGAAGPIVWNERVINVVATTTTTRIQFGDLGTANSLGSFVDNMRVFTESCVEVQIDQL